jgi:hypothetical protein
MKKQLIGLSIFISPLSFCPAVAQELTVSEATVDCGTTGYEVPVTATFHLTNKGARPLTITAVRPDCGCTGVDFPTHEVAAGEQVTVKLTYDARQLGHYQKQAAVLTSGDGKPLYLTMKGVILADLKDYSGSYPYAVGNLLMDRNYIEFDDVNRGDLPVQEIYIMNNGTTMMEPSVMHLPSYLSAVVQPRRLSPGHSGKVTLTLHSDRVRDLGLTQSSVYMGRQLGEKVSPESEMPVSVVLLPDLKALSGAHRQQAPRLYMSTDSLDLGSFGGKKKISGEIELVNQGQSQLRISSLQMFTPGLKVTLGKRTLEPGQSTKLKVTATETQLQKARTRPRVLMITNDPDHAKVVIGIKIGSK